MSDPHTIVITARPGHRAIGWRLAPRDRRQLLDRFKPHYGKTVADHVTLSAKVASDTELPSAVSAEVVGRTDDGKGVEALVVAIAGSTDRPGGGTYHITWSLEPGRAAKESDDVLARKSWNAIEGPMPIALIPARLK
jgi:hypothetical protein